MNDDDDDVTFNNFLFIAYHNSGSEITGTRTWLNIPGFKSWQQQKIFLFSILRLALGPTQPPNPWVLGFSPGGVKQQGHEVDHLPSLSAKAKHEWSYITNSL